MPNSFRIQYRQKIGGGIEVVYSQHIGPKLPGPVTSHDSSTHHPLVRHNVQLLFR